MIYLQHVHKIDNYFEHINFTIVALFIYKLVMMWEPEPLWNHTE